MKKYFLVTVILFVVLACVILSLQYINKDTWKMVQTSKETPSSTSIGNTKSPNDTSPKTSENPQNIESSQVASQILWFSPESFESLTDLKGLNLEQKGQKIAKADLLQMIKTPISFSNTDSWEMLTSNSKILKYPLNYIDTFKKTDEADITYFDIPKEIGNGSSYVNLGDKSILLNTQNNTLFVFSNGSTDKKLINSSKFKSEFRLSNLKIKGGYKEGDGTKIVLIDNSNVLYVVNSDTLKLVESKKLDDWKLFSIFNDKPGETFFYLYNDQTKILRKMQFPNEKIIYEKDLSKSPIKGGIMEITNELGALYFLVNDNNINKIYNVGDKPDLYNFLMTQKDDDGNELGNIDDMNFYAQNEKDRFLILFQKSKEYPLNKIHTTGTNWSIAK